MEIQGGKGYLTAVVREGRFSARKMAGARGSLGEGGGTVLGGLNSCVGCSFFSVGQEADVNGENGEGEDCGGSEACRPLLEVIHTEDGQW